MAEEERIVLTTSLNPALDPALSTGAYRCLMLMRGIAGHARQFATWTCSLAKQLRRCVNTVRTYRDQLEAAGYIWWVTNRRTGIVTIYIREAVEPPSRRAQFAAEREAEAKSTSCAGGAQKSAPIKTRSTILPPYRARFVEKCRKIAQEMGISFPAVLPFPVPQRRRR